jgi:S-layer family protein
LTPAPGADSFAPFHSCLCVWLVDLALRPAAERAMRTRRRRYLMSFRSLTGVAAAAAVFIFFPIDASAQVKAGPELRANTTTAGGQARSAMAVEPDGDFIVAWHGGGPGDTDYGIFGQRFSRDGSPRGGEFRANTFTTGYQLFPRVAVNARGNFVVVWESSYQNGYNGIFAQRFDPTGAKLGAEFQVNTYTTGYQQYASGVVMDAKGGFVVVWTSDQSDGTDNYGVRGQRFDASGARLGAEFAVNSYTTGYQEGSTSATQIAGTPDGRFVVVWESDEQDGNGYGVFGQRFDATGRVGAEFQVNTYTTNNQDEAAVSMAADGRFVVVWETDFDAPAFQDIRGQRFNANGTPAGAEFQASANTLDSQFVYGVVIDNQANFVVAWDEYYRDGSDWGLFGQRFSSTATPRGAEFQVNSYTTGYQGVSTPRGDEVGNFVVTWQSIGQDGDGGGVFGQRFGGLFPVTLAVDTVGNIVLEPGETVNVFTAWRNHAGSPQTFTGTLTGITGPAGATYTITDGTANHGTVPNNGTSACGNDCYAVSVSNPTPRPVPHWDASALESILPDTQGQQKRWTLHIGGSFTDVPANNGFYRFIETVFHHGITGGCSSTQYCPNDPATREQMAVFVLVAREVTGYVPAACTTPMFADVPASSPFCRWIEELARRSVVSGCGGGNYCPTSSVTREQMAVFVLRTLDPALNPPACTVPVYNDVPASSPFCRWIEELTRRGVVTGCGGGNYCPTAPVTRAQMAVFIVVTFGLALYGV